MERPRVLAQIDKRDGWNCAGLVYFGGGVCFGLIVRMDYDGAVDYDGGVFPFFPPLFFPFVAILSGQY